MIDLNQLSNGAYTGIVISNGLRIKEISGQEGTDASGSATAERTWLVQGDHDPTACRTALIDADTAGDIDLYSYDGLGLESLSREIAGPNAWQFSGSYNLLTPNVGDYTVSIDTTGGQILQTSAYSQTSYAASGQTAIDYGNSIDVQDGKPQGVQRVIPTLKINVKAKIATQWVESPMAYSKLLARLTGTTNDAPVFDEGNGNVWDAGELLFIGATGEVIAENPQLTFSFYASENVTGLTIGDIVGIDKGGHDYLWFDFYRFKQSQRTSIKPRAAYVGKIYGPADHSLMKIGVS